MMNIDELITEYQKQLKEGKIQLAYKGIMEFMSGLRSYINDKYDDLSVGSLYFGYMDMSYFAITNTILRSKNLKIAVVYLHQDNCFELWLSATNKRLQASYINDFKKLDLKRYKLSKSMPHVDSIIEDRLLVNPKFDDQLGLKQEVSTSLIAFISDISAMLDQVK
ncbi:MAG: hypothetical protein PHP11_04665 [Erysipelotrichaceae bacterium]|nr:hypothetical protein [Erysipelotrichaceae bacterium]MDD3924378.1 hypothetical protein [Erysipelotrichaceae bacterium]